MLDEIVDYVKFLRLQVKVLNLNPIKAFDSVELCSKISVIVMKVLSSVFLITV